jgi:hypothetical protein
MTDLILMRAPKVPTGGKGAGMKRGHVAFTPYFRDTR